MTVMFVRGQRVFIRETPDTVTSGHVLEAGAGFAQVELADGRVIIAADRAILAAESMEAAQARQR